MLHSPTFLLAFYSASAVTIVWMIVRILQHRRAVRNARAVRHAATAPDAGPRPVPSDAARAGVATSWESRRLFDDARSCSDNALGRVFPEDVPGVGASDYIFGRITPLLAELLPESRKRREDVKRDLQNGGFYQPHAWHNLAAVRYVAIMVPLILFGTLLVLSPRHWETPLLVLLVTTPVAGFVLPRLYVKSKAADRRAELERALPDMLDMLNMCVSQGLTIQQSIGRITRELDQISPALAQELRIVAEQAEVGSLAQSLENFNRRVDVPEIHAFTSLLLQTERLGTSISVALTDYSDGMRETLRQRADERANKAAFKLLFPTVLCLMPAVYLFLLGPALVELSDFFHGGRDVLEASTQALDDYYTR